MIYRSIFTLVIIFLLNSCVKNNFDMKLKEYNLPLQFDGNFELVQFSEEPIILLGENSENGNVIKVRIIPINANMDLPNIIKNQLAKTISNYQYSSAPYPGQLSQIVNCGTKKRPILKYFGNFSYMQLYGRDRLGLSICDSDHFTHMSYTSYFLDEKSNRVIVVDLRETIREKNGQLLNLLSHKFSVFKPISLKPYENLFQFH